MQFSRSCWLALCAALTLTAVACSDSEDRPTSEDGEAGSPNSEAGNGGSSGTGASGPGDGGTTSEPGAGNAAGEGGAGSVVEPEPEALYVVGGYQTTTDAWIGYLSVVKDITSGTLELTDAIEFPSDMSYASPGNGVVYVGNGGEPVIERWKLDEDDRLVRDGEMGLAQYGIATGLGIKDPFQFLAEDRAYFIDGKSLQVVIWNPQSMETECTFSLEGFAEGDFFVGLNFVHRDGDRLLLSARYWRPDDTAALLTRVAIIDTTTDQVSYVDDTRCGNIAFHAHDSQNNLYLASHPAQTGYVAAGLGGTPAAESCIIRFKAGADAFDQDYYVNLDTLVGGNGGGIMQGAGDEAFVMKYAGPAYTIDNVAKAHTSSSWELHRLTLGDEEATLAKVPDLALQSGYGHAFTTTVGNVETPFVITVEGDFSSGAYHDVSQGGFEQGLTIPGFPSDAILIRR